MHKPVHEFIKKKKKTRKFLCSLGDTHRHFQLFIGLKSPEYEKKIYTRKNGIETNRRQWIILYKLQWYLLPEKGVSFILWVAFDLLDLVNAIILQSSPCIWPYDDMCKCTIRRCTEALIAFEICAINFTIAREQQRHWLALRHTIHSIYIYKV